VRAKSGTRIEETARLVDLVEASIRRVIPPEELDNILDNIGLPYSTINWMYSASGTIGAGDADILVSLKENHHPTADYVRELRKHLPGAFPGTTFSFLPADMVTQILNFGLPAPVDIQLEGTDIEGNRQVANQILNELRQVPGLTDLRIQQPFDYPIFHVDVDRTKAAQGGFTPRDVVSSLLVSLSGSFQTTPNFFLNWDNGVRYNIVTMTPQYDVQSLQDLQNIPISASTTTSTPTLTSTPTMTRPGILADVASIMRANEMQVLSHYNIRRVVDIYGSVQDRDLGAVGRDITRIVDAHRSSLPRGSFITIRGQLETMRTS
jgi:multidrug efflux pump subunit AcrB